MVTSPDRDGLVSRTRALDRALQWGHYVIPNAHSRGFRMIYWDIFGRPARLPEYDMPLDTWWVDVEKARRLGRTAVLTALPQSQSAGGAGSSKKKSPAGRGRAS